MCHRLERELIANNTKYALTLQFIFGGKIFESFFPLNIFSCWQPGKPMGFIFTLTSDAYSERANKSDIHILSLKDIVIDHNKRCSSQWVGGSANFKYVMYG